MSIYVNDHPQLRDLVWSRPDVETLSEAEAFNLLERNWRFVWVEDLTPKEIELIKRLQLKFGGKLLDV